MITQYYYSIDCLFNPRRVALVYSPYMLHRDRMLEYTVGQGVFDYEAVIVANEEGVLTIRTSTIPDYDEFKFNTVLVLNEMYDTVAFVRLDSTIMPSKYNTERITVSFEYNVETFVKTGLVLTMDYHSHIANESVVHKHLLSANGSAGKMALCKDDIYFVVTDRNPYYASLDEFSAATDGMLKYSGCLYYKKGGTTYRLDGNAFTCQGEPIGFVTLPSSSQALVYYNGGCLNTVTTDGSVNELISGVLREQIEAVLDDCVIISGDSNGSPGEGRNIYRIADLLAGTVAPMPVDAGLRYVSDAVTARSLYYRVKKGGKIDPRAISQELKRILDGVLIDNEEHPGALVAATEGLVVYQTSKGFLLCSCQSITNGGAPDRFLCECDSVCVLSNSAVLLMKTVREGSKVTEVWQMAELVNEGNDFSWVVTYFGYRNESGCLFPAIYKIARNRSATPLSDIMPGLSYKGMQYARVVSGQMSRLISI